MENVNVISIYRYRREENIDMISILIFANIAIPSSRGRKKKWRLKTILKLGPDERAQLKRGTNMAIMDVIAANIHPLDPHRT